MRHPLDKPKLPQLTSFLCAFFNLKDRRLYSELPTDAQTFDPSLRLSSDTPWWELILVACNHDLILKSDQQN